MRSFARPPAAAVARRQRSRSSLPCGVVAVSPPDRAGRRGKKLEVRVRSGDGLEEGARRRICFAIELEGIPAGIVIRHDCSGPRHSSPGHVMTHTIPGRGISSGGVAHRSHMPNMVALRPLPAGRPALGLLQVIALPGDQWRRGCRSPANRQGRHCHRVAPARGSSVLDVPTKDDSIRKIGPPPLSCREGPRSDRPWWQPGPAP